MIIEFIAVPGSGKTYFSEKLYTYLKKEMSVNGIKLFNRDDINEIKRKNLSSVKSKYATRFNILFSYIKLLDFYLLRCITTLFLSPNYSFKVKCKLTMYLLDVFSNYKIINKIKREYNNKCIFILDEGLLHASSICMKECNPKNLEFFFTKLKRSQWNKNKQLFVFIDCKTKIVFDRLTNRPEGWPVNWKGLKRKKKRKELKKSYSKFKAKKDYIFKSKKKRKYYLIDNSTYFDNYQLFYKKIIKKINKLDNELINKDSDTKLFLK